MAFTAGFCIGPKMLGVDFTKIGTTALHRVGTIAHDHKGRTWVYVKANGTIGAGNFVKAANADDPYTDVVIATASAAATKVIGMAPYALAAGQFAWIVKRGPVEDVAQIVSASVAPGDPLVSDANGDGTIAQATDINNICGVCLVDDTGNLGTVYVDC